MKLALIPPVKNLEYSRLSDIDFALADVALENPRYAYYYSTRPANRFLIADNGAYELGVPLSTELLMQAAKKLIANEIVAPDYPFHQWKTINATKAFVSSLSKTERSTYSIMYVPHGKTISSWIQSYRAAEDIDCDTIGLSILLDKQFMERRLLFGTVLANTGMVKKVHHLLGLDRPSELKAYKGLGIRSVDTSMPFSCAQCGVEVGEKTKGRVDLQNADLYAAGKGGLVEKNIETLLTYLPGD